MTTNGTGVDMLISELSFPHLAEARDARLTAELERRRVVAERLAEASSETSVPPQGRRERMPRAHAARNRPRPA